MSDDRETSIRRRAYELWKQGGGDHGRDQDHWHQASSEFDAAGADAGAPPVDAPANTVAPDGTMIGNGSDTADQPGAGHGGGASIVEAEATTPAAPASPAAASPAAPKPAPRPRKPKTK